MNATDLNCSLPAGDSALPQPERYAGRTIWALYVAGATFHIWTHEEVATLRDHGIEGVLPIVVPSQNESWWHLNAGYGSLELLVRQAILWGVPKGSPLCLDVEEGQAAAMNNAGEVARAWAVACNAHGMIPWIYSAAPFLALDKFTNKWLAHWPDPTPTDPQVPEGYRAWQYAGNVEGIDLDVFLVNEIFLSPDLKPVKVGATSEALASAEPEDVVSTDSADPSGAEGPSSEPGPSDDPKS